MQSGSDYSLSHCNGIDTMVLMGSFACMLTIHLPCTNPSQMMLFAIQYLVSPQDPSRVLSGAFHSLETIFRAHPDVSTSHIILWCIYSYFRFCLCADVQREMRSNGGLQPVLRCLVAGPNHPVTRHAVVLLQARWPGHMGLRVWCIAMNVGFELHCPY